MTTDPAAALAEALLPYELPDPWTEGLRSIVMAGSADEVAAAILAALPSGWCGHSLTAIEDLMDEIEKREVEIARLRAIEEAARPVVAQLEQRYDDDWATGPVRLGDLDALRAALGSEP